ncbi:MAG: thioredoxin family protein [Pedobacter sp.]
MTFEAYQLQFELLLTTDNPPAPYDQPDYINYAKLNWSRMNRWLKLTLPSADILETMSRIRQPQHWIVITEPWCGDAAQIIPFIKMIAELSPLISVDYQLRDAEPYLINEHLTNGSKAIPKLVIQDESGKSISSWGPRPMECQVLYNNLKAEGADFETMKTELQKWYNADRGNQIQLELNYLLSL